MDLVALIFDTLRDIPGQMNFGRLTESVVLLFIIWSKLKPHLKKIEERLQGLETAVQNGFDSGSARFNKIEHRLDELENQKTRGVFNEKPSFV